MTKVKKKKEKGFFLKLWLSENSLKDLFYSCATGSAYWTDTAVDFGYESFVDKIFAKGVKVVDTEEDDKKKYVLDKEAIKKGVSLLALHSPSYFNDILAGDGDEVTADVLLQYCIFGEVKYS